jgi:hypothetical protein
VILTGLVSLYVIGSQFKGKLLEIQIGNLRFDKQFNNLGEVFYAVLHLCEHPHKRKTQTKGLHLRVMTDIFKVRVWRQSRPPSVT